MVATAVAPCSGAQHAPQRRCPAEVRPSSMTFHAATVVPLGPHPLIACLASQLGLKQAYGQWHRPGHVRTR